MLRDVWGSSSDPDALYALAGQGRAGGTQEVRRGGRQVAHKR